MAQFFGGLGGKGSGGSRFGGGTSGTRGGKKTDIKKTSLEQAMEMCEGRKPKKPGEMSADERYKQLMKNKMEEAKTRLMSDKKMNAFHLPGTNGKPKEFSKSVQLALEVMAQRQAKKEMKKQKQKESGVEIKATSIGGMYGGWLDSKGRVTNGRGEVLLKIDKKTGDIVTTGFFGRKVGKYDPKSPYCFFKIQKYIEADAAKKEKAANALIEAQNKANSGGNIWGTDNDDNGGNFNGWW